MIAVARPHAPTTARGQLQMAAELMLMGHSTGNAFALATGGLVTRIAHLAGIVAEHCGDGCSSADAPTWLREHAPAPAQVADAAEIAERCPFCDGSGEPFEGELCGGCDGSGERRIAPSLRWQVDGRIHAARSGQRTLTVQLVFPRPIDRAIAKWSALSSNGTGMISEADVRIRRGESIGDAETRAILAGMIEAEEALAKGVTQ